MTLSSSSYSSSSLSINLPLSPPLLPSTTIINTCSSSSATTCSPRCSFVNSPVSLGVSCRQRLPISFIRKKSNFFCQGIKRVAVSASGSNDMTIAEVREEGESDLEAPLLDPESLSKPRRIALFVEPSPFA